MKTMLHSLHYEQDLGVVFVMRYCMLMLFLLVTIFGMYTFILGCKGNAHFGDSMVESVEDQKAHKVI